jgi:hypothetical protein
MENENLKLWHLVEKTNPKYTKQANVRGNKITSIAPQYQIMNVTEQFGSYGQTWGFKDSKLDYTLANSFGLVTFEAIFFYPNGEFKIQNSISLWIDNAKTKVDSDFAKKVETDTLTKAISKLGFNADIFLGKFDDIRYVDEMNEEFGNDKGTKTTSATNTTQPTNEPILQWLNENDPNFEAIKQAIKDGKRTIHQLRLKYKISKEIEAKLNA